MGLTAQDMSDMTRLAQLAASPQGASREEVYLAVTSLYRVQGAYLNPRERALMNDILRLLTRDVEMTIRISLAERLAEDPAAPYDLILLLADDRIEVARPVILRSPLLSDADLLKLIAEADDARQAAAAERPNIGEPVTDVLAASNVESVLIALVRNTTARISAASYRTLIEKSRHIEAIQEPLARRPDLPPEMASRMSEWVSATLKTFIARNYAVAPKAIDEAFTHADRVIRNEPSQPRAQPGEGAQRLIEKLSASGQLKAGFLLRVLHQGQIDLFDLGLAQLLGLPLTQLRQRFYEGGPTAVALACRAAGIDKCVFGTVYKLSRHARSMSLALTIEERAAVDAVFTNITRPDAVARLRAA